MKQISLMNDELRLEILDILYEDELFNVFLIHFIENQFEHMGELYIEDSNGQINSILHMKFDGNSYFTNFYTKNEMGYREISQQIQTLNYNRVLLAGKKKDVSKILSYAGKDVKSDPDIFYKFDVDKQCKHSMHPDISVRAATCKQNDLNKMSEFMIGFFEPSNEEEIADLTHNKQLIEDINVGVFFIEYQGQPIGMARFSGKTSHYIDITTVFIDQKYRGRGFGKFLINYLINEIISDQKIPIIQTSSLNHHARRTYETLGFIKQEDYTFEFMS